VRHRRPQPPTTPATPSASALRPLDLTDLFALDIKPRGMVLDPIIPEKGLVIALTARAAPARPTSRTASATPWRPDQAS